MAPEGGNLKEPMGELASPEEEDGEVWEPEGLNVLRLFCL